MVLKRLRVRAHNFILNRQLKKISRQHQACSYFNASSIAILFDGSLPENMETIKKYYQTLRTSNKKIHVLGYIHQERSGESIMFDHITRKNLNWCFIPSAPKANDFINQPFDLLINLCTDECLPLEYLSALSGARYRVGRFISDKTFCFDLMINLNGNRSVSHFIEQVEHFLKMVK